MSRHNLPSTRSGRAPSLNNVSGRISRALLNASPSPIRIPSSAFRSTRRLNPRLNVLQNSGSFIMTKAQQQRRRNALLANPTNLIRSLQAAESEDGPYLTRVMTSPIPGSDAARRARNQNGSRYIESIREEVTPTSSGTSHVPVRIVNATRAQDRDRESNSIRNRDNSIVTEIIQSANIREAIQSNSFLKFNRARNNKITFDLGDFEGKDSVPKVLTSEKIMPRILSFMNWNELLPLRGVCKAWYHLIDSHPKIKPQLGVIVLRSSIEPKMATYNASPVTWTKFKFIGPTIFDISRPVQNEFWNKHGNFIVHIEIYNRAMSLTALVEILARCPKIEYFKCNWTPEMYSFNSELIKKYYGIHFNNGTFTRLQHLAIDTSSSLTDTALWSILRWCGGSLKTLALTSTPDEDILNRLKPRWSTDSIKNYFDRFGYTGNLQYLDFSWTSLVNDDMRSLCSINMNLKGLTLNHCKLDDEALRKLLQRHGAFLEIFKIEGTSFTDAIFRHTLPRVKVLHIGGLKGTVGSLEFLKEMPRLEELSCRNAQWLEQSMILKPFNSLSKRQSILALDFSGGLKYSGNKNLDPNLNKTWFSDFTGLILNINELNLSNWASFGTNPNFQNICQTLTSLEKLIVRGWEQLTDIGTTGLFEEEIHQDWGAKVPLKPRVFIGLLKGLKYVDLSGTSITDASIFLGLYALKNLRYLAIENTRISDNGLKGIINKIPSLDRVAVAKCSRISLTQQRFRRSDGRMVYFSKL